ncbi:MAG: hypothetical protein GKR91_15205 [Pseudomonadales bacterium]|nr:hypothetical protein [Pseudomonadales bacterium]
MLLNNRKSIALLFIPLLIFAGLSGNAIAQSMDDEIDYLIDRVGRDGCSFFRNERLYVGSDARSHLRSKLRRNAHLVNSTEDFIVKLASTSATTGRAYIIRCRGLDDQNALNWFNALITEYRQN